MNGQTQEQQFDYTLLFAANTGFSNPGPGKGSWLLKSNVTSRQTGEMGHALCTPDQKMSNIAADYTCLLLALEDLIGRINKHGSPNTKTLEVVGYSQVVIKQLAGDYAVGTNVDLYEAVRDRLNQFSSWQAIWVKKQQVMEAIGA